MNNLKEGSEYSVEMEEQEAISFEENENEIYDFSNKVSINNILHAELTSRSNGLQSESLVSSLISGYYVIPKFQRKYVWKKNQVANLALSLIKDVPIPPIYLYVNDKKREVILDGQQRATSLFLYFSDLWYVGTDTYTQINFKLANDINLELRSYEKKLKDVINDTSISKREQQIKKKEINSKIKQLSTELKKNGLVRAQFSVADGSKEKDISFNSFSEDEREMLLRKRIDITVVECRDNNAPKVYASIFKLLNSGGKLLSSQEIRNGVYWELKLYDELFDLNKNINWRKIYGKESAYSKDVEILLKILALNYFSKKTESEIVITYPGTFNWSNIMEDYSAAAASWDNKKVSEQIGLLSKFLENISNIDVTKQCNKAVFEAAAVSYIKLNNTKSIEYEWLCGLDKEKEFQKGEVLSNKTSVESRLKRAFTLMKEKYCV